MAWVERRITRTSQPQDAVGIDWSNPITRGLAGAVGVGHGTRTPILIGSPEYAVTPTGRVYRWIDGANASARVPTTNFTGSEYTTLTVFTPRALGGGFKKFGGWLTDAGNGGAFFNWDHGNPAYARAVELWAGGVTAVLKYPEPTLGRSTVWAAVVSGTTLLGYADGNLSGSTTLTGTPSGWTTLSNGSAGDPTGAVDGALALAFNRALSAAEIKSLSENPWQIFEPEIVRIWVDDQVTGGAVTGNASGPLSPVSISTVSGSASGTASASASLSAVSLSAVNGTASGASVASGVFAPVSLSAINATANGAANASASIAPISLSPVTGTASGETVVTGNASGAFDDVALSPVSGTASGAASATGAFSAISLTAINGTASGGAIVAGNAAGAFDDVSLTALTGAASGGSAGIAAGVFASLLINPATGAAYGAAVAVGSLPVIALTPLTGSATGVSIIPAYASGAFDDITLSPLTGTAAVIRRIRPIVPNYNTMSVDASYNVAYIDPTYWID